MNKHKYPTEIPHYEGRLDELVEFIVGRLRYDKAVLLHQALAARYKQESGVERARGRLRLALRLEQVGSAEEHAAEKMATVWKICEPHTE